MIEAAGRKPSGPAIGVLQGAPALPANVIIGFVAGRKGVSSCEGGGRTGRRHKSLLAVFAARKLGRTLEGKRARRARGPRSRWRHW